ncbi:hypothetical protein [Gemmata sp.]|uniref:hypothetical protein n=1 Tax=Gemmata sp. TaxID=1914242 RepID=UPI003F72A852
MPRRPPLASQLTGLWSQFDPNTVVTIADVCKRFEMSRRQVNTLITSGAQHPARKAPLRLRALNTINGARIPKASLHRFLSECDPKKLCSLAHAATMLTAGRSTVKRFVVKGVEFEGKSVRLRAWTIGKRLYFAPADVERFRTVLATLGRRWNADFR